MTAHADLEITLDLSAEELIDPPPLHSLVEVDDIGALEDMCVVDDICAMDPVLQPTQNVANTEAQITETDDSVEIEITAEQINELLGEQL